MPSWFKPEWLDIEEAPTNTWWRQQGLSAYQQDSSWLGDNAPSTSGGSGDGSSGGSGPGMGWQLSVPMHISLHPAVVSPSPLPPLSAAVGQATSKISPATPAEQWRVPDDSLTVNIVISDCPARLSFATVHPGSPDN
jgi:hypothetical protein